MGVLKDATDPRVAAERLKAILKERLGPRDVDEGVKRGIYKAILLTERFLKYAKGNEAELAVLKEQVQVLLRTGGKGDAKAKAPVPSGRPRPQSCVNPSAPCLKAGTSLIKPGSTGAWGTPKNVAQLADFGELSFTLPPLAIERRGRTKVGDFVLMRKGLDELAKQQVQAEKDKVRRDRKEVLDALTVQWGQAEERRQTEKQAKRDAGVEMTNKVEQYKLDLAEQHRQYLEDCTKKKKDRNQQVAESKARHEVQKEMEWAKEMEILENAKAAVRAQQEKERRILLENKAELLETARQNKVKIKERFMQREAERAHDAELSKVAMQMAIEREQGARAEVERIAERGRMNAKFGGMEALVVAREKKLNDDLERSQRNKEEHEREQDRVTAAKEAARKQRETDTLRTLDRQMEDLREKKQKEKEERSEFARGMQRDADHYAVLEKGLDKARRLNNEDTKIKVVHQWKGEAQRHFEEQVGLMSAFEAARNKEYIDLGKAKLAAAC